MAAAGLGLVASAAGPIVGIGGGLQLSGTMATVVAVVALVVLQAGWLLIWPSRLNIPALQTLSLVTAAYVVPLLFLNELSLWPAPTVRAFLGIITLGAVCFVIGLICGNAVTGHSYRVQRRVRTTLDQLVLPVAYRRVWIAGGVIAVALAACFAWMGFVPIVAPDPNLAKYLSGPYHITRKVAFAYHVLVPMASVMLIIVGVAAWDSKDRRLILLAVVLLLLLLGTDQRAYAGTPILVVLFVGASVRKLPFIPVLLAVLLIGPLASAANYELSHYLGAQQFETTTQADSMMTAIAAGATDVSDTLTSLGNFLEAPQPMHGRSFYANLSYSGNQYSPSQWSLRLENPGVVDLSTIVSGGVRYPTPIWGYFAWGWWGAALVSLVTGLIGGLLVGLIKHQITGRRMTYVALLAAPLVSLMVWMRGYDYFSLWACIPVLLIVLLPIRGRRFTQPFATDLETAR